MDIANAYGVDFIKSVKRSFTFKDDSVLQKDTFTLTKDAQIKERFITLTEPKIVDGVVNLEDISLIAPENATLTVTQRELSTHLRDKTYITYMLDYTLPEGENEFILKFQIQ